MDRREFLAGAAQFAALVLRKATVGEAAVHIIVDTRQELGAIPADSIGLGYEISSVARPGLLSAKNRTYVGLVRTLGAHGVIRIGGNTSDYSAFERNGQSVSAPKATVINESDLKELGTFLEATGWRLIWGLNLGRGTVQQAVEEARAVAVTAKDKLLAFEIGNEPDLFGRGTPHRRRGYSYEEYLQDYRRYKSAIRASLPAAPFAGPDAATATDWVARFAADEGGDLKLLTHHYYRECTGPGATLDKLLHADPKLAPELQKLKVASQSSGVPYRICETNSFCGGGRPGVSDTFGAALWAFDYMFTLASAGAAGVNMETGVNQLGFISSYSPIGDDEHGGYSAKPEYYGMLAFAQAANGRQVSAEYEAGEVNLRAYAVLTNQRRLSVSIVNKDALHDAAVRITVDRQFRRARALRLTAPSPESREGVMLGGALVNANGSWKPALVEPLRSRGGECEVRVPAASAAVVILDR